MAMMNKEIFTSAFVEDYPTVGGNSISQRGIHVVKVSENGTIEWIETISSVTIIAA